MAGDWIKMRVGLTTNPKVMRLAECLLDDEKYLDWSGLSYGVQGYPQPSDDESRNERHSALRVTRYVTVTALLRFWGYANEHEKNEKIAGIFREDVDEIVGVPGFAHAIEVAGWAVFPPDGGLSLPGFSEHNTSAGARSSGAERQKRYRENRRAAESPVTGKSDVTRDVTVTHREEKRREEKKSSLEHQAARMTATRFAEFWSAYPVKKGRAEAEAKWKARNLDAIADTIIADVKRRIAEDRQWRDPKYIPHGSTYVNGRGWEDAVESRHDGLHAVGGKRIDGETLDELMARAV